ncbi:MAG: peptidoglycan DD-metalloendopeptidase family protein [Spirochaeta sp.]
METIIRQQHIKRRRSQDTFRRSVPEDIYSPNRGLRVSADRILAEVQKKPSMQGPQVLVRGVSAIRGFSLSWPQRLALDLPPVQTVMMISSLLFLAALLPLQHSGGLPGTWIFSGTSISPPANIEVVEDLLLTQIQSLSRSSHSEEPLELDLSKYEEISFSEYTIQPGDTLSDVALRYGLRMDTLVSFNRINDVRRMQVGQSLQIPSRDGLRHTVSRGESLEAISTRYSISVTELIDANSLRSEVLSVGQVLFIPDARMNNTDLQIVLGELFTFPTVGRYTSGFGYRNDPFTGVRRFHNGFDIANATGTRINAARVGRVADAGVHPTYGNYVIISHDGGFQSLYAHLHTITVRRGQYVATGQRLGTMGNTGRSTGPHLHFSIFQNGNPVDPQRYLH